MKETQHAILLVAGEGKRMRPFTDAQPKCLCEIAGRRILDNALDALADRGCQTVRIVTGHFAEQVRRAITENYRGMAIHYALNSIYQTTNSMYSLYLGLVGLDEPTWVIEGDVFFDHTILDLPAGPGIVWFVDSTARDLDGAYVEADAQKQARSLTIVRDPRLVQPNQSKSIGILKLDTPGVKRLAGYLWEGIQAERQNLYYDLILGDHLKDDCVQIVDVAGQKWFEVDTLTDLEKARALFA